MSKEISINGEGFEIFVPQVGTIAEFAKDISRDAVADANEKNIDDIALVPPGIEINPYYFDAPTFVVRAWYKFKPEDPSLMPLRHDFSFVLPNTAARSRVLIARSETEREYVLQGEQAILLSQIGNLARKLHDEHSIK